MLKWAASVLAFHLGLLLAAAQSLNVSTQIFYTCMCDASAAVPLNADTFAIASDEDNSIRVYQAQTAGPPIKAYELSRFIGVNRKKPETDLEGGCRRGDRVYWITSHAQNREGQYRASRHAFFAMDVGKGGELTPAGRAYHSLLSDLVRDARLAPYRLQAASLLPPKEQGALNIEGLCTTPSGSLLIGFRNPIPQGRALLVPLENPDDLVKGKRARFGSPILLNLDGLGIRDLAQHGDQYIIIAGSYHGGGKSKLYRWHGGQAQPEVFSHADLGGINAEAIVVYPGNERSVQIMSDDGIEKVNGVPCKRLADIFQRRFRSVWVTLPD